MKSVLSIIALALMAAQSKAEQPTPADLRDDNELVRRDDVRKELELIDDQVQGIQRSSEPAVKKLVELLKDRAAMSPEEFAKKTGELLAEQRQELLAAREELLLPHQLRRLTELRWQYRAINNAVLAYHQAFALTRAQSREMQLQEEQLRDEMLAMLREFKQRSDKELLEILTPAQRAEWAKKIGTEFEFRPMHLGLTALMRLR